MVTQNKNSANNLSAGLEHIFNFNLADTQLDWFGFVVLFFYYKICSSLGLVFFSDHLAVPICCAMCTTQDEGNNINWVWEGERATWCDIYVSSSCRIESQVSWCEMCEEPIGSDLCLMMTVLMMRCDHCTIVRRPNRTRYSIYTVRQFNAIGGKSIARI